MVGASERRWRCNASAVAALVILRATAAFGVTGRGARWPQRYKCWGDDHEDLNRASHGQLGIGSGLPADTSSEEPKSQVDGRRWDLFRGRKKRLFGTRATLTDPDYGRNPANASGTSPSGQPEAGDRGRSMGVGPARMSYGGGRLPPEITPAKFFWSGSRPRPPLFSAALER